VEYLESKIYEYNLESTGKLELVFFKETVQHILKIYRVLSQPRGNAMLIGVGGSGKQSLSKLSSFIANCKISQL
jgi:dynein heavy chain, axonemal